MEGRAGINQRSRDINRDVGVRLRLKDRIRAVRCGQICRGGSELCGQSQDHREGPCRTSQNPVTQPASWDLGQRILAPVGFLDFVSPRDS